MQNFVPLDEIEKRRVKLVNLMEPNSVFIVLSGEVQKRNSDVEYPFRQNSDFWYLTGIDEENSALVIVKSQYDTVKTIIFGQTKDKLKETWTGERLGLDKMLEISGANEVCNFEELLQKLSDILKGTSQVYFDYQGDNFVNLRKKIMDLVGESGSDTGVSKKSSLLKKLRIIKSPWELEQMRQAARINTLAFSKIKENLEGWFGEKQVIAQPFLDSINYPETYEYQIEAEILNTYKQNGLTWSYPPIVAGGKNATILHYTKNNNLLKNNKFLLIDAGCEYNYYASDVTRTFVTGTEMSGVQQEIYNLVLKANQAVIEELIKVFGSKNKVDLNNGGGVVEVQDKILTLQSLHELAVKVLCEGLINLNLLEGTLEENLKKSDYKKYYMHGTSHWLGLDVHDAGDYRDTQGQPLQLKSGMVFTVEPGLYFDANDETIPAELRGLGVRIEDDIAITDHGVEVLTEGIEK